MATVNLGRIKPVNKGTWSSATTYAVDDFVQYTDSGVLSTYIAVASGSNQAPSTSGTENSSYWKYMSKGTTINVGNNKVLTSDASGNVTGQSIGTAGQFLKVNSSANGYEFATQNPAAFVKRTAIFNNTRYAHSGAANSGDVWTGSFTKLYDDATSCIYLTWMAKSFATNSDFSGVYFDIDTGTAKNTDNSDAFYGVGYTDNGEQAVQWGLKKVDRASIDAGTHNVIWGWRSKNGGSQMPGNVLNPNSNEDARMHNSAFYCFVDEILK